jgi:hypothetical protein
MEVEAEPPIRPRPRMRPGVRPAGIPESQTDPLPGLRPPGRGPSNEMHVVIHPGIPDQRHRQTRPQQSIGDSPRKMPSQQVRSKPPKIGTNQPRELPPISGRHRTQIEIHVEVGGSTRPGPVAGIPPSGSSFDHQGRHGELPHAPPTEKTGLPIRDQGVHQHSPCADETPVPQAKVSIAGESTCFPQPRQPQTKCPFCTPKALTGSAISVPPSRAGPARGPPVVDPVPQAPTSHHTQVADRAPHPRSAANHRTQVAGMCTEVVLPFRFEILRVWPSPLSRRA